MVDYLLDRPILTYGKKRFSKGLVSILEAVLLQKPNSVFDEMLVDMGVIFSYG